MKGVAFELGTQYGMAGNAFAMADVIWLKGKMYHFNTYIIEVE